MLIIGDVHGKTKEYLEIIKGHTTSIQLGDFGWVYDDIPLGHYIVGGNHDAYPRLMLHHSYLGEFGVFQDYFFIRGAHSPDRLNRIEGVDWFRNEELTYTQLQECIDLYSKTKPDIVLSHTCPLFLIPQLGGTLKWGSITERAMEIMWQIHKPSKWIFGHFHKSRHITIDTKFICLNELETIII